MRRSRAAIVMACCGSSMLAACFSFGDLTGDDDTGGTADSGSDTALPAEAGAEDAGGDAYVYIPPADGSCAFETPFGTPQPLSINSGADDWSPRLLPDELTVFFASSRIPHGEGGAGLFRSQRDASDIDFDDPVLLANVNSSAVTVHPTVTANGLNMYFQSSATGKNDLYISTRANTGVSFGIPQPLSINDQLQEDDDPFIRADGNALYFVRYDPNGIGKHQIMRAVGGATAAAFGPPAFEAELNSDKVDTTFPVVTPDDLTIFYAQNGPKAKGDYDIFKAERSHVTDPFVNATPVPELSTDKGDYPSWISSDGCTIYFMSVGATGGATGRIDLEMYVAKRSK